MISPSRKPASVDEYLSQLPDDVRKVLEQLRATIRAVAPQAEEVISYGMPGYKYHGMLVYFSAFKNHCSFFPGTAMLNKLDQEVKAFKTSTGTLQFTVEKPLPTSLVKKIVKMRMKENEEKQKAGLLKKSASKPTKKKSIKK